MDYLKKTLIDRTDSCDANGLRMANANERPNANGLHTKPGVKILGKMFMAATAFATAFTLAACTGAPCPATDSTAPASEAGPNNSSANSNNAISNGANSNNADQSGAAVQMNGAFASEALDSYRLATPASKYTDGAVSNSVDIQSAAVQTGSVPNGGANSNSVNSSNSAIPATGADTTGTSQASQTNSVPPDPYKDFPALAAKVFAHADSLYKANLTDSASAYLENFRVIKPLWSTWEAKADSMLNEFGKTRAEKAKAFEPLVLTIQNMNRVKAAYSLVAEAVDSLIAQAPGDSLVNWAKIELQNSFANTLEKAKKELAQITALADDQAQFAEAIAQTENLRKRYGDFADTLQIQARIDHFRSMAEAVDSAAAAYWEKNDPAEALKKAEALVAADKFLEAKDLLNKLKASKLRKEANAQFQKLADAFCNKQRKETSQIFAKAQKQKDPAKKHELLQKAIAPLDKCLAEYPENSQKQKVLENKQFLEKELAK